MGVATREWMQHFHEQTPTAAPDEYKMLLVNGHLTHYMYEFLETVRKKRVCMLCYPTHTTHIYQNLDVMLFGTIKDCWRLECDKWS